MSALTPGERSAAKLAVLERIIAALDQARQAGIGRFKAGATDDPRCSIALAGHEASYLLRCLESVRAGEPDPFSIEGTFRANRGRSVPEQVALAREVEIKVAEGMTREASLLEVGKAHGMNGTGDNEKSSLLDKIHLKYRDFT